MSPAAVDLTNFAPRDFRGYGRNPPNPNWPNGAKIAVNFVINYEEGGENTLDNGDAQAEAMLQEVGPVRFFTTSNSNYHADNMILQKAPLEGERDIPMETQFEYGSRRGMWRLLNLFEKHKIAITIYAVGKAYEQNPCAALVPNANPAY